MIQLCYATGIPGSHPHIKTHTYKDTRSHTHTELGTPQTHTYEDTYTKQTRTELRLDLLLEGELVDDGVRVRQAWGRVCGGVRVDDGVRVRQAWGKVCVYL